MDLHEAIKLLVKLPDEGDSASFEDHLETNLTLACEYLQLPKSEIAELDVIQELCKCFTIDNRNSVTWNFLCVSVYVLLSLEHTTSDFDPKANALSAKQSTNVRTLLGLVIALGVVPSLVPGVGIPPGARQTTKNLPKDQSTSVFDSYVRLRMCTCALIQLISRTEDIRTILVSRHLSDILAAVLQICHAPLKKPTRPEDYRHNGTLNGSRGFEMTPQLYQSFMEDKVEFNGQLQGLIESVYRPTLMKELMVLMGGRRPPTPLWIKTAITKILCSLLMEKDGVFSLARTMFDSDVIDTGADWKQLEIIEKLVFDIGDSNVYRDYYKNICNQILEMLQEVHLNESGEFKKNLYLILPRILIKTMSRRLPQVFKEFFFNLIVAPLEQCAEGNHLNHDVVVSEKDTVRSLKLLYLCYGLEINSKMDISCQLNLVQYFEIIYHITTAIKSHNHEFSQISSILIKILNYCSENQLNDIFKSLIYGEQVSTIYKFGQTLEIVPGKTGVSIRGSGGIKMKYLINDCGDFLLQLLESCRIRVQATVFNIIFKEFSSIFAQNNETVLPLKNGHDDSLLSLEDEPVEHMSALVQNKIISVKILAQLSTKKSVMNEINVDTLTNFLLKLLEEYESRKTDTFEQSQTVFHCLMMVDTIMSITNDVENFTSMIEKLEKIAKKTRNEELKAFAQQLAMKIKNGNYGNGDYECTHQKSLFEQALEDLCDPLLPTRAHGLMRLTNLIESNDEEAVARKQYALCIFQENLKNTDSYVYLTAINGLVALANAHPDAVLETLTEEFTNPKQVNDLDEQHRIRINLGEALVRFTRNLGEMAPKYKSILINTFLNGTKDDDFLIRCSSLSNVGQICQILGYKLGAITNEILLCINAIFLTDKSVEVRRACILVLYQLLKGLGNDTIVHLKEALLPIYRQLKHIYQNDKDDITKLHAQLAIEELNEATRSFLMPEIPLERNFKFCDIK